MRAGNYLKQEVRCCILQCLSRIRKEPSACRLALSTPPQCDNNSRETRGLLLILVFAYFINNTNN